MENRLTYLFEEWHQLGGAVLLRETPKTLLSRPPEEVIAESILYCRYSSRLMWIVLDWLIKHINKIDKDKLLQYTKNQGDLSVLGVLCELVNLQTPNLKINQVISECTPHNKMEIFFHRVARSPLASKLTRENALEVFSR